MPESIAFGFATRDRKIVLVLYIKKRFEFTHFHVEIHSYAACYLPIAAIFLMKTLYVIHIYTFKYLRKYEMVKLEI